MASPQGLSQQHSSRIPPFPHSVAPATVYVTSGRAPSAAGPQRIRATEQGGSRERRVRAERRRSRYLQRAREGENGGKGETTGTGERRRKERPGSRERGTRGAAAEVVRQRGRAERRDGCSERRGQRREAEGQEAGRQRHRETEGRGSWTRHRRGTGEPGRSHPGLHKGQRCGGCLEGSMVTWYAWALFLHSGSPLGAPGQTPHSTGAWPSHRELCR